MSTEIIDDYFKENYTDLVKISKKLAFKYKYTALDPDEVITDLFLHTIISDDRKKNFEDLIKCGNIRYWIIKVIGNRIRMNRSFGKLNRIITVRDYPMDILPDDNEKTIFNYIGQEDINETAEELAKIDDNYYKYTLWKKHYHDKMTFTELSIEYDLSRTPIYTIVKEFDTQIKNKILKK